MRKAQKVDLLLAAYNQLGWIVSAVVFVGVAIEVFSLSKPKAVESRRTIVPKHTNSTRLGNQTDNVLWFNMVCHISHRQHHQRGVPN